ncbi:M15 family metallopeptidase [Herbidospora cretacea]|uniref:M15 family metallopeptidase n=1 Tax=Herbidospora cretacea TaxID=28444 RepID=UPI000773B721|nr:M15 family metallopeptidase [Herbidospora cretacea]
MGEVILISDHRVTSIPVTDCLEPLVDVRAFLRVDERLADPAGAFAHLRAGMAERLRRVVLPLGVHLLVVEGYRPVSLQRKWFEDYRETLRATFPEMSSDELHVAASRFVSPVEVAPHTAGAAVDLTLCDDDGVELDMGTEVNATPEQSDGNCYTASTGISAEATQNRKVLVTALEGVGLVNYPTEWWHWSYGDRYWAMARGHDSAVYGPVEL